MMASIRCPASAVARLAQTRTACASLHHRCSPRPTARLLHVAAANSTDAHNKPMSQIAWTSHRQYTSTPKGPGDDTPSAPGSSSSESSAEDNVVAAQGNDSEDVDDSLEEVDDESAVLEEHVDEEEIAEILEDEGVCIMYMNRSPRFRAQCTAFY